MAGKLITLPVFRKAYQKLTDEELIRLYKRKQDTEIIGEFFNRYVHLIYSVCYGYFRRDDETRDMVMEIFESLGEKMKTYEIHHFRSWLYQVSRNACLMKLRKPRREISLEQIENQRTLIVENDTELHPDNGEFKNLARLRTFLTRLKDDQRICIEMMYLKKMSYREISSATGYSLKQVKSYIQNGKRNLRGFFDHEKYES
jgi:RNA polymerase sigma-70 factor (ECF subfamily)